MSTTISPKTAKVALGALGGAVVAGLVNLIPGIPPTATALSFVGIFGLGVYEAFTQ